MHKRLRDKTRQNELPDSIKHGDPCTCPRCGKKGNFDNLTPVGQPVAQGHWVWYAPVTGRHECTYCWAL